jgi:SAM-dependent methyltransferase
VHGEFDENYYLAANPDVAMAVRAGFNQSAREHYDRFGRSEGRPKNAEEASFLAELRAGEPTKAHRLEAHRFLRGAGIEIGAFESPCPVSSACEVTYVDRLSVDEARRLFPELAKVELITPEVLLDIDRDGLARFADDSQDFAIMSHVIEHVANPIRSLEEVFRVTRPGGHVVLATPDKRLTVDRGRAIATWSHLLAEYEAGVTSVSPLHYVDAVVLFNPEDIADGIDAIERRIEWLTTRAEHAHLWDSDAFRDFVARCFAHLGIQATVVFEAPGEVTRHEYFGIYEKTGQPQERDTDRAL